MRYEKNRKIFGIDELTLQRFGRFLLLPLAALILILVILALDHKKDGKAERKQGGGGRLRLCDGCARKDFGHGNSYSGAGLSDGAGPRAMQRSSIGFSVSPTKRDSQN